MKGKTHAESAQIRKEMKRYKAEGHTMGEVAERFGFSLQYAQAICKGIAPQPVRNVRNQYTSGDFDREANAIRIINERAPGFEYVGNFTGTDGFVDLKCKKCGTVITKSFVSVRHGYACCAECEKREVAERQAARKAEREAEQKRLREEREARKVKRLFEKTAEQIAFKQCPICGVLFTGKNTYCSEKCRNQNKYAMKEGYRYQFPLEEVYKRDGGVCYLCGGKCDWNDYEERDGRIVYGNNYPSRDHVIAKSKGGKNSWENIRLAHRRCNSIKRDSPLVKKIS